jgi:2-dehydro-3-deoxyphosphooctonate aldolase (KDO 8-P synthase)
MKKHTDTWVVGPCAMESSKLYLDEGKVLNKIMKGRNWYYKASFDKANRSSINGKRGLGLEDSIDNFKRIKDTIPEIKLMTDVHECWQVEKLKDVIDAIQIPAFLCRQTDLLVECAKHFDVVNIKKGQWISPQNASTFVDKVRGTNSNCEVWICERGTQFGYSQFIVDFGNVDELKKHYDKVILDCTHSTQRAKGNFTGGDRDLAEKYFLSSMIFEYDGIFVETHPNPPKAISDGDCQIYLDRFERLLEGFDKIQETYEQIRPKSLFIDGD